MTTVNANNNDDIERRIVDELDRWLDYISTAEERNEIVSGMQEKVYRTPAKSSNGRSCTDLGFSADKVCC